jgi:hypothetical protein
MEKRSNYIRLFVWGLIFLGGAMFVYTLGWEQGAEIGQQRGLMQGDMARSYWNGVEDDEATTPEVPVKPKRHNASAGHEDR